MSVVAARGDPVPEPGLDSAGPFRLALGPGLVRCAHAGVVRDPSRRSSRVAGRAVPRGALEAAGRGVDRSVLRSAGIACGLGRCRAAAVGLGNPPGRADLRLSVAPGPLGRTHPGRGRRHPDHRRGAELRRLVDPIPGRGLADAGCRVVRADHGPRSAVEPLVARGAHRGGDGICDARQTTSPLYCAAPALVALVQLIRRKPTSETVGGGHQAAWPWWALALLLSAAASAWYARNFDATFHHATVAAFGPVAELYGHRDTFGSGIGEWYRIASVRVLPPTCRRAHRRGRRAWNGEETLRQARGGRPLPGHLRRGCVRSSARCAGRVRALTQPRSPLRRPADAPRRRPWCPGPSCKAASVGPPTSSLEP